MNRLLCLNHSRIRHPYHPSHRNVRWCVLFRLVFVTWSIYLPVCLSGWSSGCLHVFACVRVFRACALVHYRGMGPPKTSCWSRGDYREGGRVGGWIGMDGCRSSVSLTVGWSGGWIGVDMERTHFQTRGQTSLCTITCLADHVTVSTPLHHHHHH